MRNIMNVFGRSPFVPLQMHMEKVAECINYIPQVLDAHRRQEIETIQSLAKKISRLEHEADIIKHDIRNSLPRGLFMPVDRANLLHILDLQDSIANSAENIGVLLTFKQITSFNDFEIKFDDFVSKCLEAFMLAQSIIEQLDELLETGFGGVEAQTVRELVDMVAFKEHESDVAQGELLRELLAHEDTVSYGDFFLWTKIIRQIANIADRSENLAMAVRMTIESN
jgi:uncharacterized protein